MTTIQCYGYSDDSAYIKVIGSDGNYYCPSDDCYDRPAFAEISNGKEGIIVSFNYVGTWAIGIAQIDEGVPIPKWAEHPFIQMYDDDGPECYTVCLEIENVPDDITIKWKRYDHGYFTEVEQ